MMQIIVMETCMRSCVRISSHIPKLSLLVLTLAQMCIGSHHSTGVDNVKQDLTCWTCPNKTDNNACNNWAPNLACPKNHTVCKTVHLIHATEGASVLVNKMCAPETECTKEHVGCRNTDQLHLKECVSCCTASYCNEFIPTNVSSAIALSSIDMGFNTASSVATNSITVFIVTTVTKHFINAVLLRT